jgi:hypothetical protein
VRHGLTAHLTPDLIDICAEVGRPAASHARCCGGNQRTTSIRPELRSDYNYASSFVALVWPFAAAVSDGRACSSSRPRRRHSDGQLFQTLRFCLQFSFCRPGCGCDHTSSAWIRRRRPCARSRSHRGLAACVLQHKLKIARVKPRNACARRAQRATISSERCCSLSFSSAFDSFPSTIAERPHKITLTLSDPAADALIERALKQQAASSCRCELDVRREPPPGSARHPAGG